MRVNFSRRHVGIICPSSGGAGSVAAVALRQAEGLGRFFDVTLISDTYPSGLPPKVIAFGIKPPSFRFLRRFGHLPREIAFAGYAGHALAKLNNMHKLDFLLCHGHVAAAFAAVPAQACLAVPYGLVTHGDIFDRPKGTYDARLTWLYRRATPIAYRRAHLIVALSPHMEELAKRGGALKSKIALIPNGIDLHELGLEEGYVPPRCATGSTLQILFVGRLAIEKGLDTLLAACARLLQCNVRFQLDIAGDGPLRSELQDMVTRFRITSHTRFLGQVSRSELGKKYHACHVVCIPSRSEPCPLVALEAMAAGRPVIGTSVGGIPWLVANERSGLVVAPEDSASLALALERASRDPEMLARMGRHGYRECQKRFNWNAVTQQIAEAIGETIAERSEPSQPSSSSR